MIDVDALCSFFMGVSEVKTKRIIFIISFFFNILCTICLFFGPQHI